MSRLTKNYAALFAILSACGSAYADRAPIQSAPSPQSAFAVDLVDEYGGALPTFRHRGRFYVLGNEGQRYSVRITNPSPRRVEAVISIDGLDAVDGRGADFANKRGYVVPPYGSLQVDGFRVSMEDVATFRFSSVPNSYAGRKGQARNVGVVGVAIFQERIEQPVYIPQPVQPDYSKDYDDYDDEAPASRGGEAGSSKAESAPPAPSRPSPAPREEGGRSRAPSTATGGAAPHCWNCGQESPQPHRPGLGTEFGERRGSRVSYTGFIRANASRPDVVVEIRYNDRDGLAALGIPLRQPVNEHEIHLRETANPFPHAPYSAPPPGWD
jgi:hypothetical protein